MPMGYFERAPFSSIRDRPHFAWPNGARLAVWVVPNIECFDEHSTAGAGAVRQPLTEIFSGKQ